MKVGIVFDGDYPWDIRIWKFATGLLDHGHEVHLICRNLGRRAEEEAVDGISIHRLRPLASSRLNALVTFPAFVNPVWVRKIRSVVAAFGLDALIVRDLPLALAAVAVGRRTGIPVLLDMAENYPAMLRDMSRFERFKPQNLLVRNPALASLVERMAIRATDHVLVVIDESRDRLLRMGMRPDRISIVGNTPKVELAQFPAAWGAPTCDDTKLTLVFVGGLEPGRGLDATLELFARAVQPIPELRLKIIGDGRWKQDLEARARALGIESHVEFAGRQEYQRALFEVQGADIGVIPHLVTAHTNSTIPNKLFEYMLLGRPVLATDMAPVRRVLAEVECGLVYRTLEDGVGALIRLRDRAVRHRLGENGRRAVLDRYRWDSDAATLVRATRESVSVRRSSRAQESPGEPARRADA